MFPTLNSIKTAFLKRCQPHRPIFKVQKRALRKRQLEVHSLTPAVQPRPLQPRPEPKSSEGSGGSGGSGRFASAPSPKDDFRIARLEDTEPKTIGPSIESSKPLSLEDENIRAEKRRALALQHGVYIVSENETLWSIAQTVYEDGRLFRALYELNENQIPNPNVLEPGVEIKTPPLEQLVLNWESSVPVDLRPTQTRSDVYVTQKGDTLFHVARIRLGQASRFNEIMELNRSRLNLDTHHLTELPAGVSLDLPQTQDRQ